MFELRQLTHHYDGSEVLRVDAWAAAQGEQWLLLGPSGSGKSTLLRMVAGLEEITTGTIAIDERVVNELEPAERDIAMVFQNYALFPHLTIFENIAFGLRRRGIKDVDAEVNKVLNLVELPHLAGRKPTQLSGGQQQRIALARAIVNRPALLLLDEPLGALDLKLRRQMQIELKWIQKEVGLTFVHVTHDQEEAMTMADTIAVMNEGQIEQMGSPADLYDNPKTAFVANFLGQSNLIKGTISGNDGDSQIVDLYGQKISLPKSRSHAVDSSTYAGIRPEKFRISLLETPVKGNVLSGGRIEDVSYIGVSTQYQVEMPWGQELMVFEQNDDGVAPFKKGDAVNISWEPTFTFGLRGDEDALSEKELKGAQVFFGKGGCVGCHNGPALSSPRFATKEEMFFAVGFGDLDMNEGVVGAITDAVRKGRGGFTGDEFDNYKFKIPPLYNLKDSDFMGHGATFATVREVVEYKNAGTSQADIPLDRLDYRFRPLELTEEEIDELVYFIEESLYDSNLDRYVPTSLPSGQCVVNHPDC